MRYLRGIISATSEEEAKTIMRTLLEKHLIAGGLIYPGLSMHWWKGKIDEKTYHDISCFTISDHKKAIIKVAEKLSADDVPVVSFFAIEDGNQEFIDWIDENTTSSDS